MKNRSKQEHLLFSLIVGLAGWLIPGGGHFLLNEKKRAIIICITIVLTFCLGIYVGSIGIVDPVGAKLAYSGQILNSPAVIFLGQITAGGSFPVYGRPHEIGQIYTSMAGLLNLLCIINAVYIAHIRWIEQTGERR